MSEATAEKTYSPEIADIVAKIKGMSILQVNDLVKAIEEEFGVTAAMPMMAGPMMMGGAAAGGAAAAVEEQTEFDVVLNSSGDKKIQVIKVVREVTSLGLAEAKKLVEEAPKVVKENIPKEEAQALKKKLEEAGATVTLK